MRLRTWLAVAAVVVIGGVAGAAWLVAGPRVPARDLTGLQGDVDRGAYVARLAGCIGCHTDAKAGGGVLAGGAAIKTDFGVFHAPNITPHETDGIGAWTLADFSRALTAGESPDGRHYYPAFPYPFYTRLTDQDIVDLWAAVRSVPAVAGRPPPHDLGFPFNIRLGLGAWKHLFHDADPLPRVEGRSTAWERGRYLAQGPAHCGACHTPRNLLGGRDVGRRYAGGRGPDGEAAPAITPEALSEDGWTRDDLAYALRSGLLPDGDVFGGAMAEVVRDGTQYWSDADLQAIADYLMDGHDP